MVLDYFHHMLLKSLVPKNLLIDSSYAANSQTVYVMHSLKYSAFVTSLMRIKTKLI